MFSERGSIIITLHALSYSLASQSKKEIERRTKLVLQL